MQLRYQAHGGRREIFRTAKHGVQEWDTVQTSAVYMAVGDTRDGVPPQLVGTYNKQQHDHHNSEWGLVAIKLALTHALETIMCRLQDEAGEFRVQIRIYIDNKRGLQLMRKAIRGDGLAHYFTQRGMPRLHFNLLHEVFTLHEKIEHVVGSQAVRLDYRFLAGNQRPFFDQNIVIGKCNELLDQLEVEYYASRRWNQVSRFVKPFDCHGWLRGHCRHGPEKCLYQHRIEKLATVKPGPKTSPDQKIPRCKYWVQGKCFNGSGCQFNHEGEGSVVEPPICVYWQMGQCFKGDACAFSHHEKGFQLQEDSDAKLASLLQQVSIDRGN